MSPRRKEKNKQYWKWHPRVLKAIQERKQDENENYVKRELHFEGKASPRDGMSLEEYYLWRRHNPGVIPTVHIKSP